MMMVARGFLAGILVLVSLLAVQGRSAQAEPLRMKFYVFVMGMKAMKVTFDGELKERAYSGTAELKPKGFAALFIKERVFMKVSGRLNDRHVKPASFFMRSRKKGKEKQASITWDSNGRVAKWERKPPLDEKRASEVKAAIANGAMDPLSMMFAMGLSQKDNPCAGKVRVFNGLTVFDIRGAAIRRERLRNMNYVGSTLKCRLVYVPVAGMSERKKRKRLKYPPVFTVWLARVRSGTHGVIWVPVQAAGRLKGRPFTATMVDATIGGKPIIPAK